MKRIILLLSSVVLIATACSRNSSSGSAKGGDTLTTEARLLTLIDHDGWTMAEIHNPWDTAAPPARYALVERGKNVTGLPEGITRVEVPVERSAVFSSVHGGIIEHLGTASAVTVVADAPYFRTTTIRNGIRSGKIADAGPSTAPSVEIIIAAAPQIILASPMQDSDLGAVTGTGIPVLEMADYMEQTPLARAEWVKLIGTLYGRRDNAYTHFDSVSAAYHRLSAMASRAPEKPVVLTEMMYSGVWYVPGGASYKATMLHDAGADYPWGDNRSTGSLPLGFADVYARAHDADIWLVTSYGPATNLNNLLHDEPRYRRIKAAVTGGVWCADTKTYPMFDEFPFSPERLLEDYVYIFHPSLRDSVAAPRYFKPLSE